MHLNGGEKVVNDTEEDVPAAEADNPTTEYVLLLIFSVMWIVAGDFTSDLFYVFM